MVQSFKEKLRHIFLGYDGTAPDERSQHHLLLLFFSFAAFLEIVFSYINYINQHQLLALVQLIAAALLLPWLVMGITGRWPPRPRELLMVNVFVVLGMLIIDGGIAKTGLYWAQIFPFASFLLLGIRSGWYWNVAFILYYLTLLALYMNGMVELVYDADTLNYAMVMFFAFTVIAFLFQRQQEKRQFELNALNQELLESEKRLKAIQMDLENTVLLRTTQLRQINEKLSREVDEKNRAIQKHEQAEMKYQQAQKMEALGTLVGGIAHDFNNMLSGISANLYLLQRNSDSPDVKKRVDKIGDLTMHAADMIRQLMTFARKEDVQLKVFDLRLFVKEAYKLARISIPEHIRCECMFETEAQLIRGEATQIQQILMNLMNNARDAVKESKDPFISVSLTPAIIEEVLIKNQQEVKPGHYTILSVQDNGCGIGADKIDRIFEPFFTTKEVGSGTGLGLSMVYGAVQSHGGYIDVVSYPGSGTRFSIYFPLLDEQHQVALEQQKVEVGEGETILLVDDEDELLEVTEQLLTVLGYRVKIARNGVQAVELYTQHANEIDLVLMDVVMPVMGGVTAADKMCQINPDVRILFMTGYDKDHETTCELVNDWQNVLNKPLDVKLLSSTIRKHLSNSD